MRARRTESEDRLYTIEEYERLPDDDRYHGDLVRGRIVREPRPGYEHGEVQLNICAELRQHVRKHRLGAVGVETGCAILPGIATVRGPDVVFIARTRIPPEGLGPGFLRIPPDLVVEVISPSNRAKAVREKIDEYFSAGVRQVWVVHPRGRNVAVHTSPSEIHVFREDDELDGGDVVRGFRLRIAEIFTD